MGIFSPAFRDSPRTRSRAVVFSPSHTCTRRACKSPGSAAGWRVACRLSADQTLLFTANRGQNHITVYDYPSLKRRVRVPLPDLQEYDKSLSSLADPRLGLHHSYLVSPGDTERNE